MNSKILTAFVLSVFIFSQSFQCGRTALSNCGSYTQDTVLLNSSLANSGPVFHVNDTVWISSTVPDNFTPLSGSASFTMDVIQLYLNAQPYQVITSSSLPQLQYANTEFNPVVKDGLLQHSAYSTGYNFLYKRTTATNTLNIGFVAGRAGLYVMSFSNSRDNYAGMLTFYRPNDHCTTYWGISTIPAAQQNKNYWDTLGVTAVSLPTNYGGIAIAKNMRNYFFFRVIP
jgi:hypothetical protein